MVSSSSACPASFPLNEAASRQLAEGFAGVRVKWCPQGVARSQNGAGDSLHLRGVKRGAGDGSNVCSITDVVAETVQ